MVSDPGEGGNTENQKEGFVGVKLKKKRGLNMSETKGRIKSIRTRRRCYRC